MDVRKFVDMNFDTPALKAFDWLLAAGSIGYGLYANSLLWLAAGFIGAVAAWYRPLSRTQRFLLGFVKTRR